MKISHIHLLFVKTSWEKSIIKSKHLTDLCTQSESLWIKHPPCCRPWAYFSFTMLLSENKLGKGVSFKKQRHHLKRLLLDFLTKMSYFTSQEVVNPLLIIKNVELSRFQLTLQNPVTFIESLFTLKPFKAVYLRFL